MKTMMLVLLLSLTAQAESVTYTAQFDSRFPFPTVPDFDPSLGWLTAVQITWAGQASGDWHCLDPIDTGTLNIAFGATAGTTNLGTSWTQDSLTFDTPTNFFLTDSQITLVVTPDPEPWTGHVTTQLDCQGWINASTLVQGNLDRLHGTETIEYTYSVVPEPTGLVMGTIAALVVGLKLYGSRNGSEG